MYRHAEKKFRKRRLILGSRIVLEARIYEPRIHTLESPNFVKYIKGCLPRRRLDKDILGHPPPHSPSSRFQPSGRLSRVEMQRALLCLFIVPHGRRRARAGTVVYRSFVFIVNNRISVPSMASIGSISLSFYEYMRCFGKCKQFAA